jgi:hypothetical protein
MNIYNKIGYIFILKDINQLETLKNNISKILHHDPNWIGICHNLVESTDDIIDEMRYLQCKYNIVMNYNQIPDLYILDQFINNIKNGWTIVNIVGEEFNEDLYLKINKVNNANIPIALIKNESESINEMAYFNYIYKFLKGSKVEIDEETDIVRNMTYEEKIKEKSPDMIKTWEQINEINRSISN